MVYLILLLMLFGGLGVAFMRYQSGAARADIVRRQKVEALTIRLSPAGMQMIENDRTYALARARLVLEREQWQQEFQLKRYLALSRIPVDQYGTYLLNQEDVHLTHLQPVYKPAQLKAPEPLLLDTGQQQQPSQDFLLSQLSENSLIVSPGVQASNGQVVKVSIVDVPHLKIIGATGFGKSCLAGAILDQATQLNSPDVLQLALLDLEHKTSRLFEDLPHVASLKAGKRRVSMVATSADEVAEHLGILKTELDRRAKLSEATLEREAVLLMYVEEMLSLQYEVVDPKLLNKMFAHLTVLSVRGRKYKMFLLCVMQADYSTDELKVSQKMFRFRGAAAIDTTTARAAGFMNTDLVKQNFSQGQPGQFVVEYPSFSDIVLAPTYDVKRLIAKKASFTNAREQETPPALQLLKGTGNTIEAGLKYADETAWEAKVNEVQALRFQGWLKVATVEKVWKVKPGATQAYKDACQEYDTIIAQLDQEARA